MKLPLVSVVIPTYNRPNHLERAVKSVLNQTYSNIEILVVDDGSSVDLRPLERKYSSVRFLKNDTNRGGCYSRNRGLKVANGDYINFLDDDDELYPKKIELQIEKFKQSEVPNLGMITCHLMDGRSGIENLVTNKSRGNIYKKMLSGFAVAGTEAMLFKATVFDKIDGFDEDLESSQEYDLFIRASEHFNIDYVDKVLSKKNRSSDQISLNFDKKINGARYLFSKYDQKYRSLGLLFWLRMQLKLKALLARYYVGKILGERAYRFLGVR